MRVCVQVFVQSTVCVSTISNAFVVTRLNICSFWYRKTVGTVCVIIYCVNRSLERKLQRPLLAKSRTLPSIPQSPTVSRVHQSDLIGGSPLRRKTLPATTSNLKACTLPPAGKLPPNSIFVNVYKLWIFFFSANMSLFPLYFSASAFVGIMLRESTHWQRLSIHVLVRDFNTKQMGSGNFYRYSPQGN